MIRRDARQFVGTLSSYRPALSLWSPYIPSMAYVYAAAPPAPRTHGTWYMVSMVQWAASTGTMGFHQPAIKEPQEFMKCCS